MGEELCEAGKCCHVHAQFGFSLLGKHGGAVSGLVECSRSASMSDTQRVLRKTNVKTLNRHAT